MNRVHVAALTVSLVATSSFSLHADVRADEKSHVEFAGALGRVVNIFGGKAAREGVTSTVAVKGDRKATLNDAAGQIVDLAEEKIYDLDMRRKTYKVTTFAELRRQMEEAERKAQEDAQKESPAPAAEPAPTTQEQKQMEIDFNVKDTGETRAINGFDTRQAIMTIAVREKGKTLDQSGGLLVTSDMWIAPKIAAMTEIAEFELRYMRKLQGPMVAGASPEQLAAALALYPGLKDAIARMRAEGVKMEGTAIQTTTKIEAVKSPEDMERERQQKEQENKNAAGSVGGLLGGFAKKMAQKKAGGQTEQGSHATVMTLTGEVLKVTTAVTPADVAVPAGFTAR